MRIASRSIFHYEIPYRFTAPVWFIRFMRFKRNKDQAECEEMNAPSFASPLGRQVEEEAEVIELAPGETSLSFLQKIYRSVRQPMSRRMRAAIEALPHEHPRLGAVAISSVTGRDFASMLERAIQRSGKHQEIMELKAIDVTPQIGNSD
jgi:hypothetical protein